MGAVNNWVENFLPIVLHKMIGELIAPAATNKTRQVTLVIHLSV